MHILIEAIANKHRNDGIDIYDSAPEDAIQAFEARKGIPLPDDFKAFC